MKETPEEKRSKSRTALNKDCKDFSIIILHDWQKIYNEWEASTGTENPLYDTDKNLTDILNSHADASRSEIKTIFYNTAVTRWATSKKIYDIDQLLLKEMLKKSSIGESLQKLSGYEFYKTSARCAYNRLPFESFFVRFMNPEIIEKATGTDYSGLVVSKCGGRLSFVWIKVNPQQSDKSDTFPIEYDINTNKFITLSEITTTEYNSNLAKLSLLTTLYITLAEINKSEMSALMRLHRKSKKADILIPFDKSNKDIVMISESIGFDANMRKYLSVVKTRSNNYKKYYEKLKDDGTNINEKYDEIVATIGTKRTPHVRKAHYRHYIKSDGTVHTRYVRESYINGYNRTTNTVSGTPVEK